MNQEKRTNGPQRGRPPGKVNRSTLPPSDRLHPPRQTRAVKPRDSFVTESRREVNELVQELLES
jgi:hypothetical protein